MNVDSDSEGSEIISLSSSLDKNVSDLNHVMFILMSRSLTYLSTVLVQIRVVLEPAISKSLCVMFTIGGGTGIYIYKPI